MDKQIEKRNWKEYVVQKRAASKHALEKRKWFPESVEDFKSERKVFLAMFSTFREKSDCKSNLFAFWNEYIFMVMLLLQFTKAERTGVPYTLERHLRWFHIFSRWTDATMQGGFQFTLRTWLRLGPNILSFLWNLWTEIFLWAFKPSILESFYWHGLGTNP